MKTCARPAVLLTLLATAAVARTARAEEPQPFSRSRWIREQTTARFDGGVQPATEGETAALLAFSKSSPTRRRPRPDPAGPPNVRISADILDADPRSGAQAETEAEPSLAANPEDEQHLVAGYQEDRFASGGARVLTYAVSRDGGQRWSEGILPGLTVATDGAFERASDPWVAFGDGGRVYFAAIAFDETSVQNGITLSRSDDGGSSWGSPVLVHFNRSRDFDDKEAVVVDSVADSPFRGRVYVAWDTVVSEDLQLLRIAHSDDGGATWSAPVDVGTHGQNIGALPFVGPGGVVSLLWKSYLPGSAELRAARSTDGGSTWSEPVLVALPQTRGVAALRTGELFAAAIDPRNGRLYLVWPDQRFTPGADQIVLAASDDGVYWTEPLRVSDGPDDAPCFTPAVAVNGQGRFGVAYSTLRLDPARSFLVDQYLVTTNSRGRLTGAGRVSTRSFDVREAAVALGFFLGDYQGLVAGRKIFRPVWVATSEDSRFRAGKQSDVVTLWIR
jgi:hypothetical protein